MHTNCRSLLLSANYTSAVLSTSFTWICFHFYLESTLLIVVADRFYIKLFILHSPAHSLCLHVILHKWIAFYSTFLNIHGSGVLTALAWLVLHTAAIWGQSVYTILLSCVTSCKAMHVRCMSCNLPPALLAEWPGSFMCCCSNTGGWNGYRNESAQSFDSGEENCHTAPAGIWTCDLLITSLVL